MCYNPLMPQQRTTTRRTATRPRRTRSREGFWVRLRRRIIVALILLGLMGAAWGWLTLRSGIGPRWLARLAGAPTTLEGRRIGVVVGHAGNDSGAVCPDGLTEASVNQGVAKELLPELARRGAQVELLNEFDARLKGYRADAFVSIHADSCGVDLSGYKVASLDGGSLASETLADCLWDGYGRATGLPRHPNTVTYDMREYHAFREIAPSTPAAILETGFLKRDRRLLTQQPGLAAAGIVSGLECFLAPRDQDR